jgi:hypothetical protein
MAKGLGGSELRRLAQIGAQARLAELESERANLLSVFPGLRRTHGRAAAAPSTATPVTKRRRRRSNMSAAGRKAVSERMKKYWANRRASAQKRKGS